MKKESIARTVRGIRSLPSGQRLTVLNTTAVILKVYSILDSLTSIIELLTTNLREVLDLNYKAIDPFVDLRLNNAVLRTFEVIG